MSGDNRIIHGQPLTVLSLFDGMSCGQQALDRIECKVEKYYAAEIDRHAVDVTQRNYPQTIQVGDVLNVRGCDLPKIDLLIGGSPCQGFSIARGRDTSDDPRNQLMYEYVRVLREVKPTFFLYENVVMNDAAVHEISSLLGVEPVLINSDLFVPQNRPRLYWTNIPIEQLPDRPAWDYQYWQFRRNHWRQNQSGVCPCLTANMGTGGNNVPYIEEGENKRVLTCEELEQLQGVRAGYTAGVSATQRKKMIGNGWTVDVIAHIFKGLLSGGVADV